MADTMVTQGVLFFFCQEIFFNIFNILPMAMLYMAAPDVTDKLVTVLILRYIVNCKIRIQISSDFIVIYQKCRLPERGYRFLACRCMRSRFVMR